MFNDGFVDLFARLISASSTSTNINYLGLPAYNMPAAVVAEIINGVANDRGLDFISKFYFEGHEHTNIKGEYNKINDLMLTASGDGYNLGGWGLYTLYNK